MGEHGKRAKELFLEGYNCSQSIAGAYAKELGMDMDTLMCAMSSFGGGMGRMREVCGTVTGMLFVAGILYGYSDPNAKEEKAEHYARVQELAGKFREKNGSIICRELLSGLGVDGRPIPSERTKEYYKKRPCAEFAAQAADILENYIKELV